MENKSTFIRTTLNRLAGISLLITSATPVHADSPVWWGPPAAGGKPVISTPGEDGHAAATVGQAKWMARRALDRIAKLDPPLADTIRGGLTTGSPAILDFTVPGAPTVEWQQDQLAPLLVGQLKAIATPFYDALHAKSSTVLAAELTTNGTTVSGTYYPWPTSSEGNKAIATTGQLKAVFSLRFETMAMPFSDADNDMIDDSWEALYGIPSGIPYILSDTDGDGINAFREYFLGFNPTSAISNGTDPDNTRDRDGDGMPDEWEARTLSLSTSVPLGRRVARYQLDWENPDADGDLDDDGLSNLGEYTAGSNPAVADTDGDELLDGVDPHPTVIDIPEDLLDLATALSKEVDDRLAAVTVSPADAMPLFSNTTAHWTSTTFVPNADNWLQDLRPQLTGIHMYAGDYHQSYGMMPITRRHVISCGHNGPRVGNTVRYVKEDGTVFETTILKWINDHSDISPLDVSDTKQTPAQGDLSIYLLADELPTWVNIAPIFPHISNFYKNQLIPRIPTVRISQGNLVSTPKNREVSISSALGGTGNPTVDSLRASFWQFVAFGDSGTPIYFLIDHDLDDLTPARLYLYEVCSGEVLADFLPYINSMISRADAAAGITTGYGPVTAAPMPSY